MTLDTPFGTFRAPNISPDPEDGIGAWDTADFVNAMSTFAPFDMNSLPPAAAAVS